MKKLYDISTGDDLFTISEESQTPIIDGLLYKSDYVLVVAEPKRGKTILTQQMACSITSGDPFLNTLDVLSPQRVWYFATEGKTNDLKDRFVRMSHTIKIKLSEILLITTRFRFNTKEGLEALKEILEENKDNLPGVIIVDAIYRAIRGSIKNDDVVNDFHHIMGWLSHECNDAAVILVHHMTKPQRNQQDGAYFTRSDMDSFGSTFLTAGVDHVVWLDKCQKNPADLILRCDTQRSGKVIENLRLKLVEPDPLYYELVSIHQEERHRMVEVLRHHIEGLCYTEIQKRAKIGRSTFYVIKKELLIGGIIEETGTRPKLLRLKTP